MTPLLKIKAPKANVARASAVKVNVVARQVVLALKTKSPKANAVPRTKSLKASAEKANVVVIPMGRTLTKKAEPKSEVLLAKGDLYLLSPAKRRIQELRHHEQTCFWCRIGLSSRATCRAEIPRFSSHRFF